MATALTTITNISNQVIPVLVDTIKPSIANESSNLGPTDARQVQIAPGAQFRCETQRLDLAQLDRLRSLKLLSYQ